jgi:hypothetical protein
VQEKLEVHIGTHSPEQWARYAQMPVRQGLQRPTAPLIVAEEVEWASLGLLPRWVGDDPSNAVAALEVSGLNGGGWARFQDGTVRRDEPALYISTSAPPDRWDPTQPYWGNVVPMAQGRIRGVELPHQESVRIRTASIVLANEPELADGLSSTDRDLAQRIRNIADARWMALEPYDPESPDDEFDDVWQPLLITPDGHTVAGVWTDTDEHPPVYHYVVPRLPSYEPILRWLTERAVPNLIPTAAARTRAYIADQPNLHSTREHDLTEQLADLDTAYEKKKTELQQALADERAVVTPVRDGLLFGSGTVLENAVARVLVDAGVTVTPLDAVLGTRSADLLVEYGDIRLLVEVKSVGGNAAESLAEAAYRHLRTWPQAGTGQSVDGAVLVVNHQHKRPPAERSPAVFGRREFVDTLDFPVVSTLALFDLWRQGDAAGVRQVLGLDRPAPRA